MKRKHLKKILLVSMVALVISLPVSACSSGNEDKKVGASSEDDNLALYITAMQQAVEKNSDLPVEFSFNSNDYVVADLGDGIIDIRTEKATVNGEKVRIRLSFAIDKEHETFTYHFLEVGNEILLDDNTLE